MVAFSMLKKNEEAIPCGRYYPSIAFTDHLNMVIFPEYKMVFVIVFL